MCESGEKSESMGVFLLLSHHRKKKKTPSCKRLFLKTEMMLSSLIFPKKILPLKASHEEEEKHLFSSLHFLRTKRKVLYSHFHSFQSSFPFGKPLFKSFPFKSNPLYITVVVRNKKCKPSFFFSYAFTSRIFFFFVPNFILRLKGTYSS